MNILITTELSDCRKAVELARQLHDSLYSGGWYDGISEDHYNIISEMVKVFKNKGFKGKSNQEIMDNFWNASLQYDLERLNKVSIEELEDSDLIEIWR